MSYFDLGWEARTNDKFRGRIASAAKELQELEKSLGKDPSAPRKIADILQEVYQYCNYNPTFLLPHMFPQYPGTAPLSLSARTFATAMMDFRVGGFTAIRGSRQIGKALEENEPVLTPTGWIPIKQLVIGDVVYDSRGKKVQVTGVFPQGNKPIFEMKFNDGAISRCCSEHLWKCKTAGTKRWTIRSLKEIRNLRGGDTPTSDQGIRIPLTGPVAFPSKHHHIHPYVLGALIGDGGLTEGNLKITSADPELIQRIRTLQSDIRLCTINKYGYNIRQGSPRKKGKFRSELERLGLRVRDENKHIPDEYLRSSITSRTELLRGLMDTDGSIYGKSQMEYYTASSALAEGVKVLVQSLGGKATIKTKETHYKKGEIRVDCRTCYRVKIWLQEFCPFWLPRKAERFYKIRYKPVRILQSVKSIGVAPAVCITVDSPDKTFLTRDYVVTHNSTTLVARQLANAHLIPRWRSLYICPHTEHQRTYANKMHEMEMAFRYFKKRHDFRSNLNYKEYPNGAMIELIRVLTSTAAARGKMGDELLYDEYQLFDPDFEPDIEQIQTVSQMPVRIYAGTSTHLDSPLEHRYQGSSQGVWFARTHYTGDNTQKRWIDTSDPDQVIPIIKPRGPTCPHSGHLLDMTNGCWVHKQESMMKLNRIGIHIPQLIIPNLVNSTKGWLKLYTEFQDYPRDKFLQEVLGIPTEAGSREITEADLRNICLNPDGPQTRLKKAQKGFYRYIVSGCDWGGSELDPTNKVKTSFSVHVIMGLNPYNRWELLHIYRYPGMDYRMVVDDIVRNHVLWKAEVIGSDYGAGMAYNSWIRASPEISANKHMVFQLGGNPTSPILAPFNTKEAFNCFILNKTESLTGLFIAIKDKPPEIIGYDWGDCRKFLLDFLNLYRVPHETDSGARRFRYLRNPARSDDVVQAMNFALAAGRVMQGRSVFEDDSLLDVVRSRLYGQGGLGGTDYLSSG